LPCRGELDAVVVVVCNLDVVQRGAGADAAEGETVDLVVSRDFGAAVPDTDVLHGAGVVVSSVAAVCSVASGQTLDGIGRAGG
jgi:hypothetical protein